MSEEKGALISPTLEKIEIIFKANLDSNHKVRRMSLKTHTNLTQSQGTTATYLQRSDVETRRGSDLRSQLLTNHSIGKQSTKVKDPKRRE